MKSVFTNNLSKSLSSIKHSANGLGLHSSPAFTKFCNQLQPLTNQTHSEFAESLFKECHYIYNNEEPLNKQQLINQMYNFLSKDLSSFNFNEYSDIDKLLKRDESQPFFVTDFGDIIKQYQQWNHYLPYIQPYYAVKCNSNINILKLLRLMGTGFDCASENEFKMLFDNNIITESDKNEIIFSNPCKHPSHLKYANDNGINLCTFDNEYELQKIKQFSPNMGCLLRIAVDDSYSACQFNSKFGYVINSDIDIHYIYNICKELNINFKGIMFHVGSGCTNPVVYYKAIETCSKLFKMANDYGFEFDTLDIGGGFPGINTDIISFPDIALQVNKGMKEFFNNYNYTNDNTLSKNMKKIKVVGEPGRYFVYKSHTLAAQIMAKKKCKDGGFTYYLNDGIYGSFNCVHFDHASPHFIPIDNDVNIEKPLYKSTLFGPTCDSVDKICDEYWLPEMNINDHLIIPNFGAYTAASSTNFNGFMAPKSFYKLTL